MELLNPTGRTRCYGCHRPKERCFCDRIPVIANRTHVLIIQHVRERFHPFNTARILKRSLINSQLLVQQMDRLAVELSHVKFSKNAALLYPGPDSQLLDELPEVQRPQQLVVLDGTWHHTKTLLRDIPLLQSLPQIRLVPAQPSRYKIRREPNLQYVSTLEATVAALEYLEPDTAGLDKIVAAFEGMVEDQLSLPMSGYGWRRNLRRRPLLKNIPRVVQDHLESIVIVYGETAPGMKKDRMKHEIKTSEDPPAQTPVYWAAERMVSGERFECAIAPPCILSSTFLQHLELSESVFQQAVSIDQFREAWEQFLRTDDVIGFYYSNIFKLLSGIGDRGHAQVHLKSIQLKEGRRSRTLEQMLVDFNVQASPVHCKGRAGKRLASTVAYTSHLHRLARQTT